ncbi:hypothetical protein D3C87_2021330 [compost metagenome]
MPVRSAPQVATWMMPSPKICLRSAQSRLGSISSPMMNRNSTTPSSAAASTEAGSEISPVPEGPSNSPAAR